MELDYDKVKEDLEEINKRQNGKEYWKMLVLGTLENLMEVGKEYKITDENVNKIVENLMSNEIIWEVIDEQICNELFNYKK